MNISLYAFIYRTAKMTGYKQICAELDLSTTKYISCCVLVKKMEIYCEMLMFSYGKTMPGSHYLAFLSDYK